MKRSISWGQRPVNLCAFSRTSPRQELRCSSVHFHINSDLYQSGKCAAFASSCTVCCRLGRCIPSSKYGAEWKPAYPHTLILKWIRMGLLGWAGVGQGGHNKQAIYKQRNKMQNVQNLTWLCLGELSISSGGIKQLLARLWTDTVWDVKLRKWAWVMASHAVHNAHHGKERWRWEKGQLLTSPSFLR